MGESSSLPQCLLRSFNKIIHERLFIECLALKKCLLKLSSVIGIILILKKRVQDYKRRKNKEMGIRSSHFLEEYQEIMKREVYGYLKNWYVV